METSNMKGIPAMSAPIVHDYIRDLGRNWTGQGTAMEVGCWLGATSAALLEGLVEAGYDKLYWAFDRWVANEAEKRKAGEQNVSIGIGENLLPIFRSNTKKIYSKVHAIRGIVPPVLDMYNGDPIEICMFDAPKKNPVFLKSLCKLGPHFIPGVTVLGLLDYYHYRRRRDIAKKDDWVQFLAPAKFISQYEDHFTKLEEFPNVGSCAFFRYEKQISWKQ